jgi:hypothetical protein
VRREMELECGPLHHMAATSAKPPSKTAWWPIVNGFKSLMVEDSWFSVRWPKPNFGYSSMSKNGLLPLKVMKLCLQLIYLKSYFQKKLSLNLSNLKLKFYERPQMEKLQKWKL